MLLNECFDILLIACDDPIRFEHHETIKRIKCNRNPFSLNPVMIAADPFLAVKDDRLYLFYEEYRYRDKGIIKMTSTCDLVTWSVPQVVLSEHFHLSYPWVFKHEGQWYMMPETAAAHEIRLYKATNNDFGHFELDKTLLCHDVDEKLPAMDFCDSSIVQKDNVFYLFTTVNYGKGNELQLYYSDNLGGPYEKHPLSPLVVGDKYGRNGGTLLEYGGILYRFAQDCDGEYGKNINLFSVNILSKAEYKEEVVQKNVLSRHGIGTGHHFNFVFFKGKFIVAVDQKLRLPFLGCKVKHLFKLMRR